MKPILYILAITIPIMSALIGYHVAQHERDLDDAQRVRLTMPVATHSATLRAAAGLDDLTGRLPLEDRPVAKEPLTFTF